MGKTYVSKMKANRTSGTQAGFSAYNGFKIVCNNDSQAWENTIFALHVPEYSPTSATVAFKLFDCIEGSSSYKGFGLKKINNDCQLFPTSSNAIDLGSSTNKWKSFNGINPGALSLPSISSTGANAWIALDTTDWVKNTAVSFAQKYTPLADGWLNVRVDNATMLAIAVGGNYMHQIIRSETANSLALLMPVFKNTEVAIMVGGNENLAYNRVTFYYCQGNV